MACFTLVSLLFVQTAPPLKNSKFFFSLFPRRTPPTKYRYRTRDTVHKLPPVIRRFPATTYHPPTFSQDFNETHLIRAPIPPTLRARHYSMYVEITHRCRITFHFASIDSRAPYVEPLVVEVPIIITEFPDGEDSNGIGSGDDGVQVDLNLPEYTPQYESAVQVSVTNEVP